MIGHIPAIGGAARYWSERHFLLWSRLVIVAGTLGATIIASSRASERNVSLLAGVWAAMVFLRWPPLGLVALIGASLVVPFAIGTGTESALNAAMLLSALLAALWILTMIGRRDLRLVKSGPILPLLAFCGVATLAFVVGLRPLMAFAETAPVIAQVGGLALIWLSAAVFLLVGHQVRDVRWLQIMTWFFLALGSLYMVGRLVPEIRRNLTRFIFQPGADGGLFWVWIVALALSQVLFNHDLRVPWRLALGALLVGTLYTSLVNDRGWVSGWLPSLVVIVVILWIAAPRLGILATLASGAIAVLQLPAIIGLVMIGDNEYSAMTRVEAWRIMADIVAISPVIGLGPANYYWYTPFFSILGYNVNFNSHNNFIDIAAQMGLLGLAFVLWFLWAVGRLGWQLRSRVRAGFQRAYVCGALGGLAGTVVAAMLGDWLIPFVYNLGVQGFRASVLGWLFLGGLVALEMMSRQETAERDKAAASRSTP